MDQSLSLRLVNGTLPKLRLASLRAAKDRVFLDPVRPLDGGVATREVEALTAPVFIAQGAGEKSWGSLKDDSLAVTSLFEKDGQVWLRGYQMPSAKKGRFRDWEIFNLPAKEMLQKGGNH